MHRRDFSTRLLAALAALPSGKQVAATTRVSLNLRQLCTKADLIAVVQYATTKAIYTRDTFCHTQHIGRVIEVLRGFEPSAPEISWYSYDENLRTDVEYIEFLRIAGPKAGYVAARCGADVHPDYASLGRLTLLGRTPDGASRVSQERLVLAHSMNWLDWFSPEVSPLRTVRSPEGLAISLEYLLKVIRRLPPPS